MTGELRWRILILQAIVAVVFAVGAGIAFYEANFARDYVRHQLSAQRIFFPAAGSASLPADTYPDLQKYGGEQVDTGPEAKAYAGYIQSHLETTAEGRTYSEQSTFSRQNPDDAKAAAAVQTLFRGETLRGMLLNAWGWWTIGTYTFYAGWVLALAAIGVGAAFIFELVIAPRRRQATDRTPATGRLAPQQ
jgi:hypothetical protein